MTAMPVPPGEDTPVPGTPFIVWHDGEQAWVHVMADGAIELTGTTVDTWYVRVDPAMRP